MNHLRHVCRPVNQRTPTPAPLAADDDPDDSSAAPAPTASPSVTEDDVFSITLGPDTEDLVELEDDPEEPQEPQGNVAINVLFHHNMIHLQEQDQGLCLHLPHQHLLLLTLNHSLCLSLQDSGTILQKQPGNIDLRVSLFFLP